MKWRHLILHNFQVHAKRSLKIGPGVTTIVGPTDKGKSAVLRALRWLIFNRPTGTAMVRHGAGYAKVTLFLDKFPVSRVRGKGKNLYRLNGADLVAFGADPPDVIRQTLNVSPDSIQRQHDPLFWLSLSPGDLAKRLNAMTGFDRADQVRSGLAARRRQVLAERQVLAAQLKQIQDRLALAKKLRPVFDAGRREQEAAANHAKAAFSCGQMAELVSAAESARKAVETATVIGDAAQRAFVAAERRKKIAGRLALLEKLIADRKRATPSWLNAILAVFARWQAAKQQSAHAYDRHGRAAAEIDTRVQETEKCRKALKRLKVLAAKSPLCPTCGQSRCLPATGTSATSPPPAGRTYGTM